MHSTLYTAVRRNVRLRSECVLSASARPRLQHHSWVLAWRLLPYFLGPPTLEDILDSMLIVMSMQILCHGSARQSARRTFLFSRIHRSATPCLPIHNESYCTLPVSDCPRATIYWQNAMRLAGSALVSWIRCNTESISDATALADPQPTRSTMSRMMMIQTELSCSAISRVV
jgi:hypothetical protein